MGTSSNKAQKEIKAQKNKQSANNEAKDATVQKPNEQINNNQNKNQSPNEEANKQNEEKQIQSPSNQLQTDSLSFQKYPFNPNQSIFQAEQTNRLLTSYQTNGECVTIAFGGSFEIFDSFFESLYMDHNLDKDPQYEYLKFFSESPNEYNLYSPRGFAYDIPNEQTDIFKKSVLNSSYKADSLSRCTFIEQSYDEKEVFIKSFLDDRKAKEIHEQLRKEVEKCHNLHQLHFISDIFNGSAMGLLSSFLYEIQNDYKTTLKIAHLKYIDSFKHKTFSKRKNYIFSVANLHNQCTMINLLNSPRSGEVINTLTAGDRISEYSSKYNMNKLISAIVIDPKANFIYSNGWEIQEKTITSNMKFVFVDCKEGRGHMWYCPQYSSICIYKGNKCLNEEVRNLFEKEMEMIMNSKLSTNKGYFSFLEIDKRFENDFAANFHHSNVFREMTEEYYLDFLQDYNLRHFTSEERDMRDDTIYNINEILNYYKEVWKLVK